VSGSLPASGVLRARAREYLTELEPLARAHELRMLSGCPWGPGAARRLIDGWTGHLCPRGRWLGGDRPPGPRQFAGLGADARTAWREGLELLKTLVTRATAWEASDDRQALGLADRLERVVGGQAVANPVPRRLR